MARNTEQLWFHRNKWYLKYSVPRSLQQWFVSSTGRPMSKVTEPLDESLQVAMVKRDARIAWCTNVFAQAKAGLFATPEQATAALRGPDERREVNEAVRRWVAGWPAARENAVRAAYFEHLGDALTMHDPGRAAPASATGETVSQAAEAWFAEMTRDKAAAPRETTIEGHRRHVQKFTDRCRDLPLTEVTRAVASDFLAGLKGSNGTRNAYATTLKCVVECARRRGRFTGDNPFDGQKAKVARSSYQPFTVDELQKLFAALPREVRPNKHSPETALPWIALMALYTGMRLEEIAQLRTADVREENANGGRLWCIDVHNGGDNKLKNEISARLIPVHSELVRLGLLDYVKALPEGPLFPGLTRRKSKGNKVGARVGELFRKKLASPEVKLKRPGLCFHSFRHTVSGRLDAAGVPQSDAARVLGHAVKGETYGTYSQPGPGLKRVAGAVEQIVYEGLRL
jgi:integrase